MADLSADAGGAWPAPAKLNLFLHITGRRDDGYHELQTVFQFIDWCDLLHFEVDGQRGDIHLETTHGDLPAAQNLVMRAARALADYSGCRYGVRIHLDKQLPIGGGLGGGSSDAATTLVALNRLWDLQLDTEQLMDIGLTLGADVPVFVGGQAAWAEGVGERLTPLPALDEPWYAVVCPAVQVSTAAVFAAPELTRNAPRLKIRDFPSKAVGNHLQAVVTRRYPQVAEALEWLSRHGEARMTGTGACVFAACAERAQAQSVIRQLPDPWKGFVARGCNRSPLLRRLDRQGR